MKKRGPLLAAFCIPLLITLIICVNREIYPFGDQCMLHIDMYHQYCPFFTELMEKLKTGGSPFYSWNIGLGADFVSLYAYYLASPLNWLLILWPRGYVIEFMTVLSILKIALSGLTFTYYLGEHFHVWQDAGNAAAVTRTEKKDQHCACGSRKQRIPRKADPCPVPRCPVFHPVEQKPQHQKNADHD